MRRARTWALVGAALIVGGVAWWNAGRGQEMLPPRVEGDAGHTETLAWYTQMRAYPRKEVDWEDFQQAALNRDTLMAHPGTDMPVWSFVGPTQAGSSGSTWFGPSPVAGRVSAIAWHPTPGFLQRVYAGSPSGGLWLSNYPLGNWSALSNEWPFLAVSSIAICPDIPNIVVVGTGDFHGGRPLGARGIMRSTDGGTSWTHIVPPFVPGIAVSGIVFDPDDPAVALATSGRGGKAAGGRITGNGRLHRSVDRGGSWGVVPGTPAAIWSDVKVGLLSNTTGVRFYYASALAPNGMVWRSGNRGQTWEQLPVPLAAQEYDCVEIAPSASEPETVYLMAARLPAGAGSVGVWRSKTGGKPLASWKRIDAAVNTFPNGTGGDYYNWSQSDYNVHLTCASYRSGKQNVDLLYAGLIDLVASANANAANEADVRWKSAGQTYTAAMPPTHNDQQSMAIRPGAGTHALVGNDGGLYDVTFDPTAATWSFASYLNTLLHISELYSAAWYGGGNTATHILAGAQDNQHYRLGSAPNPWPNATATGDGFGCAIIPVPTGTAPNVVPAGNIQYGSAYTGTSMGITYFVMKRTNDNWATQSDESWWFNVGGGGGAVANNEPTLFFPPIGASSSGDEVYIGSTFLYRKSDNAAWVRTGLNGANTTAITALPMTAIAVAPSDPTHVYVGAQNGTIYVSRNRGAGGSWTKIDDGLFGRPITSISVNRLDPNQILISQGGNSGVRQRVWYCRNTAGAAGPYKWSMVSGPDAVTGLQDVHTGVVAFDPDVPDLIFYAGTDIGFFYTRNGGVTWHDGNTNLGLPKVGVTAIKVIGSGLDASVYVSTYGRGIWRVRFGDLP